MTTEQAHTAAAAVRHVERYEFSDGTELRLAPGQYVELIRQRETRTPHEVTAWDADVQTMRAALEAQGFAFGMRQDGTRRLPWGKRTFSRLTIASAAEQGALL